MFGDLPPRLMLRALLVTPFFLEPILISCWSTVIFVVARSQRLGVISNLTALHPHWSKLRVRVGAWRVFWNFALTLIDAARWETGTGSIDWSIDGLENMQHLAARTDGCIILTAHMGNYDIAAPVFASRFHRVLYTVRSPERQAETQRIKEEEIRSKELAYPNFRTLYNRKDDLLGIELARLLGEGHVVAVQGDRVIFDVSPMTVETSEGLSVTLPKGPLYLARATGAPTYPLFIVREGWRRYRVTVLPELQLPPRKRGEPDPAPVIWAETILAIVKSHWQQWYVFEPLLSRRTPDPGSLQGSWQKELRSPPDSGRLAG